MVGIIEDEGSPLNALNIGAVLVTALLGGAILWNALMNQEARPELAELPPGASAKLTVSAEETPPRGGTITLRFDPVVEDVQKALAESGFYTGPIDGVSGRRTKTAIESFQSANGLDVTGQATPELAERIRFAKQIAEAAGITSSTAPAAADKQVLHVQQGLTELGYPPGPIDGMMREETREAIRAFERDRGLPETGEVSERLLSALATTSTQSAPPQE